MGKRSRKRPVSETPNAAPAAPRRRVPSAERDAAARAELAPLKPGERPLPLKIAAGVCVLFAVSNVVLSLANVEVNGPKPGFGGVLLFAGILLVAAWGIWTQRYWAVLGFQALLAISVMFASLAVLVASNIAALALCLATIVAGGWLFWKLVRVLGRMKVPRLGDA